MVNWSWFNWYDPNDLTIDEIVISWDTAMKATELSDYSVGTVRGVRGSLYLSAGSRARTPGLSGAQTQGDRSL